MEQDIQILTKLDNTNNSPSLLSPKHFPTNNGNDHHKLMKRDEWSEEAVSCLLEAYEAKWSLRNRAKLKGRDWHDVAKCVSARAHCSKSAKTHTQCKNKIESMKKRYRSELAAAATGEASSWPLYRRLDRLLRGNGLPTTAVPTTTPPQPLPASPPALNSHCLNSVHRLAKLQKSQGDGYNNGMKLLERELFKSGANGIDSSADQVMVQRENMSNTKTKMEMTMMRWVAEVIVKNEQARMETMREIERIRMEAEEKRGEFELKRTEIIANAQLQIAKIFAKFGEGICEFQGMSRRTIHRWN